MCDWDCVQVWYRFWRVSFIDLPSLLFLNEPLNMTSSRTISEAVVCLSRRSTWIEWRVIGSHRAWVRCC